MNFALIVIVLITLASVGIAQAGGNCTMTCQTYGNQTHCQQHCW